MGQVDRFLRKIAGQTAVYWPPGGRDAYGQPVFAAPREIPVRWIDTAKAITSRSGEEYVTRAEVVVMEDVEVDGYLYLGQLGELSAEEQADPRLVVGAGKIVRFDRVPVPLGTDEYIRRAYL